MGFLSAMMEWSKPFEENAERDVLHVLCWMSLQEQHCGGNPIQAWPRQIVLWVVASVTKTENEEHCVHWSRIEKHLTGDGFCAE